MIVFLRQALQVEKTRPTRHTRDAFSPYRGRGIGQRNREDIEAMRRELSKLKTKLNQEFQNAGKETNMETKEDTYEWKRERESLIRTLQEEKNKNLSMEMELNKLNSKIATLRTLIPDTVEIAQTMKEMEEILDLH